jgi:hypothetical protein
VIDADVGRALLAGLIAGVATAMATTVIALRVMVGSERWRERAANTRVPLPLVGVVVVNGAMLAWTALGLVLGALYHAGGNPGFSLIVAASGLLAAGAGSYVIGRVSWPLWATVGIAVAAFAGLLPLLAR